MASLIIKLFTIPISISIADLLTNQINYPSVFYYIITGYIIAIVGYVIEIGLLRRGTLWMSTILDFFVATIAVFAITMFLPGANITFWGATITGLIIGAAEYATHLWLIKSDRVKEF